MKNTLDSQNSKLRTQNGFTDRMFRRLFIPTLFSALGLALGDIADALFVGIRIGAQGLAVMSIVAPVYMIYNVLDVGIAVGASVHYTKALGKGKAKDGIRIFSQMLMVAVAASIVIGALGLAFMPHILKILGAGNPRGALYQYTKDYLTVMYMGTPLTFLYFLLYYCIRCDDAEKLASIGYLTGYLTDVGASALFILVFKWDVKGAIYATVLGKAVGVCIFCFHFTRKWAILRFRFVRPDLRLILSVLKTGMSSSAKYIGQFAALLIVNNVLRKIGGESALAQLNVVQNVSYVAFALFNALGDTSQPLSGTFFAEHNRAALKRVMTLTVIIGLTGGALTAALGAVFAPQICSVFGLTGATMTEGVFAVRLFCLSVVPAGVSIMWSSCFQAIGREKIVFLINQLRSFALYIILALAFSAFGIRWFWLTFLFSELGSLCIWIPVYVKKNPKTSDKVFTYLLTSDSSDTADMLIGAGDFLEENEIGVKQSYFVTMCVEEVCRAIIDNAFTEQGNEYIQLTLCKEPNDTVTIHIRDNAVHFNPFDMKTGHNYDDEEQLASLGIQMVKTKSRSFFYRRYAGFNTLTVEV
ncbi:MAG: hypothetical protein K6G90_08550 [Clostridia bacterium]|nr:hypothetical protein [Clostridia bacterium]